jgi:hypothetical protein
MRTVIETLFFEKQVTTVWSEDEHDEFNRSILNMCRPNRGFGDLRRPYRGVANQRCPYRTSFDAGCDVFFGEAGAIGTAGDTHPAFSGMIRSKRGHSSSMPPVYGHESKLGEKHVCSEFQAHPTASVFSWVHERNGGARDAVSP